MTLSNLYGHPVIMVFWASWSEPSIEELEYLQNQKLFGEDLIILAVNDVDGSDTAKETLEKHHITLPLIVDHQRQIAQRYGINCWPTTISIDAKGIIRSIYFGVTETPDLSTKTKQTTNRVSTEEYRKNTHHTQRRRQATKIKKRKS